MGYFLLYKYCVSFFAEYPMCPDIIGVNLLLAFNGP